MKQNRWSVPVEEFRGLQPKMLQGAYLGPGINGRYAHQNPEYRIKLLPDQFVSNAGWQTHVCLMAKDKPTANAVQVWWDAHQRVFKDAAGRVYTEHGIPVDTLRGIKYVPVNVIRRYIG